MNASETSFQELVFTPDQVSAAHAKLTSRSLERLLVALIAAVTLAVFAITYRADFVHWDDNVNIYENPHLRGVNTESLRWMFTDVKYIPRYLPLGWLSLAVNYEISGLKPASYHIGNLLFHVANSILVFLLLKRLLRLRLKESASSSSGILWAAAVGTLFWSIHPLRAEPVAWASARIYCQALFFLLLSLLNYLRFRHEAECQRSAKGTCSREKLFYWCSVLAFLASLLTYPIAFGFLVVLVALDFYPFRHLRFGSDGLLGTQARRAWLEKVPFLAAALSVFAVTMWARIHSGQWAAPVSIHEFGIVSRTMQALYVYSSYIWKTLAPLGLCPTYTTLLSFSPWEWPFMASLALVAALSVLLMKKARQWPAAPVLWVSYLALLLPMVGLSEHPHYAYDRYSYLTGIIFSVAISWTLLKLWERSARRAFITIVVSGVLLVFSVSTFVQVRYWNDSVTLLNYIVSKLGDHPSRSTQDMVLGVIHLRRNENAKAEECFRQAVRFAPNNAEGYANLGDALSSQNKFFEAIAQYQRALQLNPASTRVHQNLGIAFGSAGRFDEALACFEQILKADPTNSNTHRNLAVTLAQLGRNDEAAIHEREAQRLRGQR